MRGAIEAFLIGAMWVFVALTFAKCIGAFEPMSTVMSATPRQVAMNAVWASCRDCLPFNAVQISERVWKVDTLNRDETEAVIFLVCTEGETVAYRVGEDRLDETIAKHQKHLKSIGYEPPEPASDVIKPGGKS